MNTIERRIHSRVQATGCDVKDGEIADYSSGRTAAGDSRLNLRYLRGVKSMFRGSAKGADLRAVVQAPDAYNRLIQRTGTAEMKKYT